MRKATKSSKERKNKKEEEGNIRKESGYSERRLEVEIHAERNNSIIRTAQKKKKKGTT